MGVTTAQVRSVTRHTGGSQNRVSQIGTLAFLIDNMPVCAQELLEGTGRFTWEERTICITGFAVASRLHRPYVL